MKKKFTPKSLIFSAFMFLFIIDLYLFGGGRVVEVFGVTLRMIMFSIALLLCLAVFANNRIVSQSVLWIFLFFILVLIYSSLISAVHDNFSSGSITAYLFFLVILFFYCFREKANYFIGHTIAFSAVFMSLCYLSFLGAVFFGLISFLDIYNYIPHSEVFLRGQEGFVYKGFIYILIGALYFCIVDRYKITWRLILFFLCFFAIVATLTRGFVLSLLLVMIIYFVANSKSLLLKLLVVFCGFLIPLLVVAFYPDFIFRADSDSTRINDIYEFLNFINNGGINLILGDGISAYLGDRPGVENAYMDTWLRFGLLGLFLLLLCFIKISIDYLYIKKYKGRIRYHDWLYYSIVLIFVQSNFNPYINNYIGGTFLMFALVYFDSERMNLSNVSHRKRLGMLK